MVKIRAKTVLKLDTGSNTIDYEYPKGMAVEEVAKDLLHAVVQNKGTAGAKEFVTAFLADYDPDYPGIVPSNGAGNSASAAGAKSGEPKANVS